MTEQPEPETTSPDKGQPEPDPEPEFTDRELITARRQPAYDAVYAYIRSLGDQMPPDAVHRNAIIWRGVAAALDALNVGCCVSSHCVEGDHVLVVDEPTPEPETACAHCGDPGHAWDNCQAYTQAVAQDAVPANPTPAAHAGPCGQHCTHTADAQPALTWAESIASHGSGPTTTVDIDVNIPGEEEPAPLEIPLDDARTLHAMLGDLLAEHDPAPEHCGDSKPHPGHKCMRGGVVFRCPGSQPPAPELRDQVAEALMRWAEGNNAPQYAAMRRPDTVRQNAYGRADAVLAVPAIRALAETRDALRVTEGDRDAAEAELHRLREESPWLRATAEDLAEANAAIERVRALHRPVQYRGRPICVECSGYGGSTCDNGPQPHPCPTITALDPQEPS